MSGIVGQVMFHPDGAARRAALRDGVAAMLARMRHRGPDGFGLHDCGQAVLGQALLDPAGETVTGPWQGAEGGAVLVCDARLDRRDTLAQRLGCDPATTDPALILHAWDRWGEGCVDHLEGDFAFAIWDPEHRRLFAARDRLGVKPLVYRLWPDSFCFASDINCLRSDGDVADPVWIAGYLTGQTTQTDRTALRDVLRLEPGHRLLMQFGAVEIRRYWHLQAATNPAAAGTGAPALRERLGEAVAARMRGGPVGAMLSGGLDSSSVAMLARRAAPHDALPVFSMTFPSLPAMDESRYIAAVLAEGGFDPVRIEADTGGLFEDMAPLLAEQGQPFSGLALATTRRVYAHAAQSGVRVLLDGHGGDEVISSGLMHLHVLARQGAWNELWQTLGHARASSGDHPFPVFASLLAQHLRQPLLRALARRVSGRVNRADTTRWRRLLSAELVTNDAITDRVRAISDREIAADTPEQRHHIALVTDPRIAESLEILDRSAAWHGIEARYPFLDRHVIETCVNAPSADKIRGGWTRSLLRDAMDGILPDPIRQRRDKAHFLPNLLRGLAQDTTGALPRLRAGRLDAVAPYVDMAALRQSLDALERDGAAVALADFAEVWRVVWLDQWLRDVEGGQQAGAGMTDDLTIIDRTGITLAHDRRRHASREPVAARIAR